MIININNIGQMIKSMSNEHVRNAQSAKKGQGSADEAVRLTLTNQEIQEEEIREIKKIEVKQNLTKAFFAVTEGETVVIKIVDEEGNLIRQIPPEEYLRIVKFLKENHQNLFSREV